MTNLNIYNTDGIIRFMDNKNNETNNEAEQPAKRSLQRLQRRKVCRKGGADEDCKKATPSRVKRRAKIKRVKPQRVNKKRTRG